MAATHVTFRWLDILEKEFDKAFVDLDILIGKANPGVTANLYGDFTSLENDVLEVTQYYVFCILSHWFLLII